MRRPAVFAFVGLLIIAVLFMYFRASPIDSGEPTPPTPVIEIEQEQNGENSQTTRGIPITPTPAATPDIATPDIATPDTPTIATPVIEITPPTDEPPTAFPSPTSTTASEPTPTATPTPTAATPTVIPPPPALLHANVCVAGVQNITSPQDLHIFTDDQTYMYLEGSAFWTPGASGRNFLKYKVFYYDPDYQPYSLEEYNTPVGNGALHTQDIRRLVLHHNKAGWYTIGILGIGDDYNHFPLGSNNQGCFIRVYLPRPR